MKARIDLSRKDETAYRDKGYFGVKPQASVDKTMHQAVRNHPLSIKENRRNKIISRTRSLVERSFAVIKEKVFGNPILSSMSTAVVEGYNNNIRQRISRFGRKTAAFSKKIGACVGALNMFQFMNNFIDSKRTTTPAMRESITDHIWTWREFLTYHIQL